MCNRYNQFNMTHAFASYLLFGNLNAASVANDPFVADPLIFSTMTFPILHRAKNPLAKQTSHLGLVCSVIDGFRLCHLAMRAFQNRLRRSKADGDLGEVVVDLFIFSERHVGSFQLLNLFESMVHGQQSVVPLTIDYRPDRKSTRLNS